MKTKLLSIFALIALFVACDKNDFNEFKPGGDTPADSKTENGEPTYIGKDFTVTNYGKTVTFKMILVEKGSFNMGTGSSNNDVKHVVELTKDYYMGETEVIQDLWLAVMGSLPTITTSPSPIGDNYPVYRVTYDECVSFANKLNDLTVGQRSTGQTFHVPTEAEWEFAAMGGNKSQGYTYAGSNDEDEVACYGGRWNYYLKEPKTKKPNELGIYDMSGNVYEWCSDWYAAYPSAAQKDPTGPETGEYKVIRGSGTNSIEGIRYRDYTYPDNSSYANSVIGLRIALR